MKQAWWLWLMIGLVAGAILDATLLPSRYAIDRTVLGGGMWVVFRTDRLTGRLWSSMQGMAWHEITNDEGRTGMYRNDIFDQVSRDNSSRDKAKR